MSGPFSGGTPLANFGVQNKRGDFMLAAYDDQLRSSVIIINGNTEKLNGNIEEFVFINPEKYSVSYSDDSGIRWVRTQGQISGPF